jgi:probable F420-dependent oxidoreductase
VRAAVSVDRREAGNPRSGDALSYDRVVHLGVILPNFDRHASPDGVRAVVEAAEELELDSVWTTEHIIVGPEAVNPYGRVLDPLITLAWIAGWSERIGLGTSIVLVPLHHPIHLAKEVATLQEISGGRFRLGIGLGWHEDEFGFMGVPFERRGRRTDEAIRLMKALWAGEREFHGELWSFENATFEPRPAQPPEIWVGGASDRAIRRARELGDVWHPSRSGTPERIREVKEQFPDLRVIPRVSGTKIDEYLELGCEGVVASFGTDPARIVKSMRELAARRV